MITIQEPEKNLHTTVMKNLDRVMENRLRKEYDYVLVIVGKVGDGKSMLASLACSYMDKKFPPERVLFTGIDYKMIERKLKEKMAIQFDEGEEVFFSRGAMTRLQKQMVLKFAQIRQRNHFIVICVPSLFLLEKWMRGIGDTRINCIWRIVRRGMFYCYADKHGTLSRIRIDHSVNKIFWPKSDFISFWKEIPKSAPFWKEYLRRKKNFLTMTRESRLVAKERDRVARKMSESLTVADIAEIQEVGISTVRQWLRKGMFPKRAVFMGLDGRTRVKFPGYQRGVKRLEKEQEKTRRKMQLLRMKKK